MTSLGQDDSNDDNQQVAEKESSLKTSWDIADTINTRAKQNSWSIAGMWKDGISELKSFLWSTSSDIKPSTKQMQDQWHQDENSLNQVVWGSVKRSAKLAANQIDLELQKREEKRIWIRKHQ